MGNAASTRDVPVSSTGDEASDENEVDAQVSGVFLGENLQRDVVEDFQSDVLKVSPHRSQKAQENMGRKEKLELRLSEVRKHNEKVHSLLDSQIDELKSRFSDLEVEIRFDADRIEQKIGDAPQHGKNSCIDARADLATCYRSSEDPSACKNFVEALERCVTKTLATNE